MNMEEVIPLEILAEQGITVVTFSEENHTDFNITEYIQCIWTHIIFLYF